MENLASRSQLNLNSFSFSNDRHQLTPGNSSLCCPDYRPSHFRVMGLRDEGGADCKTSGR